MPTVFFSYSHADEALRDQLAPCTLEIAVARFLRLLGSPLGLR